MYMTSTIFVAQNTAVNSKVNIDMELARFYIKRVQSR